MARLANGSRAIVNIRKIEAYCLSPTHPRGRHKARLFREALGLTASEADWLRQRLLEAADTANAFNVGNDPFGSRWRIDVPLTRQEKRVVVRSLWIIRTDEDVPRFVTCWVL